MRSLLASLSVGVGILLLLASCTAIPEDERYIYVPLTSSSRAVLIEDFTGQRCVNCPNAAEEIERLKKEYGTDSIIAVGIHSGPLAVYSRGKVLGLRTEEGDEYYDHWGVEQEPMGLINRRGGLSTVDNWFNLVNEAIKQPTDIYFDFGASCSQDSTLHVYLTVITGEPIDAKLQLWLTESNITALQMMPDGSANQEYIHNHVFRCSINGTWGEPYQAAQGEIRELEYECKLDAAWKPENLSVVAFIYDDSGVEYVAETHVLIDDPTDESTDDQTDTEN